MKNLIRRLLERGIPAEEHCPMALRGSFRIGGRAALAVFPRTREELLGALSAARETGCRYAIVGKGSNLLFPDGEYSGAVLFTGGVRTLDVQGEEWTVSAGFPLITLAGRARGAGMSGLEFAAGIPGTVGGAVLMNAGAFGGCMAQVVSRSEYWDAELGVCGQFAGAEQAFGVRTSVYEKNPRYVILNACLHLHPGNPEEIAARMEDCRRRRQATQPQTYPNAGSIFRHPPGQFAGKLIEDCGLKGVAVGGAAVSEKHAGFIVNRGDATERDVLQLISLIRERVRACCGITLACELRRLDGREI